MRSVSNLMGCLAMVLVLSPSTSWAEEPLVSGTAAAPGTTVPLSAVTPATPVPDIAPLPAPAKVSTPAASAEDELSPDFDVHDFIGKNYPKLYSMNLPSSHKDSMEIVNDYRKKAALGDTDAMVKVSVACFFGRGTKLNPVEGNEFAQNALAKGNAMAAILLADSYASGRGVEKNTAQAFEYLKKAGYMGSLPIETFLYKRHLTSNHLDYAQSYFWVSLALRHLSPVQDSKLVADRNSLLLNHIGTDQKPMIDKIVENIVYSNSANYSARKED